MSPRAIRHLVEAPRRIPFRRGVAILPSLFTVANMFCGYCAIILAFKRSFEWAVTFVVIAGILDSLDGRIARMTGTTSDFGKELDSLSDFLSFGLAPALVLYHWGLKDLGRTGWLLAFLLPVAGAMRLARFNVQAGKADKRFFVGLPIPAAAAAAVLPLYFLPQGLPRPFKWVALSYVVLLSFFMVSTFRYRSFKDMDLRERRSPKVIFLVALVLVLVALHPPAVLLAVAVTYALSGPLTHFLEKAGLLKKAPKEAQQEGLDVEEEL
ncbi:MAG: CDP-diacylglycerol--serine O-phosphatidyltransferase [Acidobacteriota bacterium]